VRKKGGKKGKERALFFSLIGRGTCPVPSSGGPVRPGKGEKKGGALPKKKEKGGAEASPPCNGGGEPPGDTRIRLFHSSRRGKAISIPSDRGGIFYQQQREKNLACEKKNQKKAPPRCDKAVKKRRSGNEALACLPSQRKRRGEGKRGGAPSFLEKNNLAPFITTQGKGGRFHLFVGKKGGKVIFLTSSPPSLEERGKKGKGLFFGRKGKNGALWHRRPFGPSRGKGR